MRVTPRIAEAVNAVRAMIADGTLKPGQRAPGAAELHEKTGISVVYCTRALQLLESDGTLIRTSPRGRVWRVSEPA